MDEKGRSSIALPPRGRLLKGASAAIPARPENHHFRPAAKRPIIQLSVRQLLQFILQYFRESRVAEVTVAPLGAAGDTTEFDSMRVGSQCVALKWLGTWQLMGKSGGDRAESLNGGMI